MEQAIKNIRHMLDLAHALRAGAQKTQQTRYSEKLLEAAAELDARAETLSKQSSIALI